MYGLVFQFCVLILTSYDSTNQLFSPRVKPFGPQKSQWTRTGGLRTQAWIPVMCAQAAIRQLSPSIFMSANHSWQHWLHCQMLIPRQSIQSLNAAHPFSCEICLTVFGNCVHSSHLFMGLFYEDARCVSFCSPVLHCECTIVLSVLPFFFCQQDIRQDSPSLRNHIACSSDSQSSLTLIFRCDDLPWLPCGGSALHPNGSSTLTPISIYESFGPILVNITLRAEDNIYMGKPTALQVRVVLAAVPSAHIGKWLSVHLTCRSSIFQLFWILVGIQNYSFHH